MKRALFLVPEALDFDALTEEQQAAIASVGSQWTLPMPGTVAAGGQAVVDGITTDDFDPGAMSALGLDWTCIGLWQWDEASATINVLVPLDGQALLAHLPPTTDYDDDGNVTATHPPVLHVPHQWAGWPEIPTATTGEAQ